MSSSVPIVIDPESLTTLWMLANAAFLDATDVPKDTLSDPPPDTATVTTLHKTSTPARLPTTFILRSVHRCELVDCLQIVFDRTGLSGSTNHGTIIAMAFVKERRTHARAIRRLNHVGFYSGSFSV